MKPCVMAHVYNPRTWKAEQEDYERQASLEYIDPVSNNNKISQTRAN